MVANNGISTSEETQQHKIWSKDSSIHGNREPNNTIIEGQKHQYNKKTSKKHLRFIVQSKKNCNG